MGVRRHPWGVEMAYSHRGLCAPQMTTTKQVHTLAPRDNSLSLSLQSLTCSKGRLPPAMYILEQ